MIRSFQNGDIKTSGRQFLTGDDAVGRGIYHRLRFFLGEYFINITDGTPWFNGILGKTPQDIAEVNLKQRILTAPGVAEITRFKFEPDPAQRSLTVTASVTTENGGSADVLLDEDII